MLALVAGCAPAVDRVLPEPVQSEISDRRALDVDGRLTPIATFRAEVVVLGRRDYPRKEDDPMSLFSPVDLAVGWGVAGTRAARDMVSIGQVNRRYRWRIGAGAPRELRRFGLVSANWHMIPVDERIAAELEEVEEGDVVIIEGHLVAVGLGDGRTVRSSLTRDDDGDGACEIVAVSSLRRA